MSSSTPTKVILTVVLSTLDEDKALEVQQQLKSYDENLSFSPCIEREDLKECLEFRGSGDVDEKQKAEMIAHLCDDFDQDGDDYYWAYGFNTTMFNPLVYYLAMEFI